MWKSEGILAYHGLFKQNYLSYNKLIYNLTINWEIGKITVEPLSIIVTDYPISCASYAKDSSLLDVLKWKYFLNTAKYQPNFFQFKK